MSKCKCPSVSVQRIFRKSPSQCFREKAEVDSLSTVARESRYVNLAPQVHILSNHQQLRWPHCGPLLVWKVGVIGKPLETGCDTHTHTGCSLIHWKLYLMAGSPSALFEGWLAGYFAGWLSGSAGRSLFRKQFHLRPKQLFARRIS